MDDSHGIFHEAFIYPPHPSMKHDYLFKVHMLRGMFKLLMIFLRSWSSYAAERNALFLWWGGTDSEMKISG